MEVIKTVAIRPDQQEYLDKSCINFSKFVRQQLDKEMELRDD
jgi:hypothetical protein